MKAKAKKAAPQKKTTTRQTAAVLAARAVELPPVAEATAPVSAPIANDVSQPAPAQQQVEPTAAEEAPVSAERPTISSEERRRRIALAAYRRAERLGFGTTNPVEDWLVSEREVDAMLAEGAL
jgi:hypothetical protein